MIGTSNEIARKGFRPVITSIGCGVFGTVGTRFSEDDEQDSCDAGWLRLRSSLVRTSEVETSDRNETDLRKLAQ